MKPKVIHNFYLDCPYLYWILDGGSGPIRTKDTKKVSCKWCCKNQKKNK